MWDRRLVHLATLRKAHGNTVSLASNMEEVCDCLPNIVDVSDLRPWGYETYLANSDYANLARGLYWGIGPRLRSFGFSDQCASNGGDWYCASIQHYNQDVEFRFGVACNRANLH